MTGYLYIDGHDVYTRFGIGLMKGGHNELVAFPPLKSVNINDWQEYDGIDPDLSAPVLDTRTLSIRFGAWHDMEGLGAFIEYLSDGAYHDFYFGLLKRQYRLRLVSHSDLSWIPRLGFATFKFADDFPFTSDYSVSRMQSDSVSGGDFALDGRPLTEYGVRVLKGTLASIDKSPEVKQNLLRNIKTVPGVEYDPKHVTFKSKEVQVKCLMRTETAGEFWSRHDALLHDLIQPGLRRLYVRERDRTYSCYYKSCKTVEFVPVGRFWWEFTLTFVFTDYRPRGRRAGLRFVSGDSLRLMQDSNIRLT